MTITAEGERGMEELLPLPPGCRDLLEFLDEIEREIADACGISAILSERTEGEG